MNLYHLKTEVRNKIIYYLKPKLSSMGHFLRFQNQSHECFFASI